MNIFCEECGNKLTPGDKFCQNCGTPVAEESDLSQNGTGPDFFRNSNLLFKDETKDIDFGIILTNYYSFENKLGKEETNRLQKGLDIYIDQQKKKGINYLVLDASDNYFKKIENGNWKHYVDLLIRGINIVFDRIGARITYVMILGGTEIVPMPIFQNPYSSTHDKDIDSDFPYCTLSVSENWEQEGVFTPRVLTGRIPTGNDTTTDDILTLLQNTQSGVSKSSLKKSFGLSAQVWEGASKYIYDQVGKKKLHLSPEITLDNIKKHYRNDTAMHYFNLHGGNTSPFWVGQLGTKTYPVAFTPSQISQSKMINILGVEACYGARFINLNKADSILLSALGTKTVSFVGSSRVAYGQAKTPINHADIVIQDFLLDMQNGTTAGEAFLNARFHAFKYNYDTNPILGILTMLEFNLFGDPAFSIKERKFFGSKNLAKDFSGKIDNLEISENDLELAKPKTQTESSTYSIITNAVDEAQRKITNLINQNVWNKYPDFKGITPKYHKFSFLGKNVSHLAYKKTTPLFDQYILVSTDESGNVIDEVLSK